MIRSSVNRDTLFNLAGSGIPLMVAALIIPGLLHALGAGDFGLLALIWALIGYFGIFDFGVGRALTFDVARVWSTHDHRSVSSRVQAGFVLTLIAGGVGMVLVSTLIAPNVGAWFDQRQGQVGQEAAFLVTALAVLPATLTSGIRGALEGLDRFKESNINRMILGTLMFLGPYACILIGKVDLLSMAVSLAISRFFVLALGIFQIRKYLFESIRPTKTDYVSLLSYGSWVTVSSLVSPLMVYGDRFLVAAAIGSSALTFYAIPQEGLQRLLVIPMALAGALLPRIASRTFEGSTTGGLYKQNMLKVAVVMLPICIFVAGIAEWFLAWWISPDFAQQAGQLVTILCLGLWVNSVAQIPMTFLQGLGEPRVVALVHIAELIIYMGLVIVLADAFGLMGAAWAWTIRVIIDLAALHYFARKVIGQG